MEWRTSSPHLQKALLAASVIRWAKGTDRPEVLRAGRQIYGKSLVLLQRALDQPMASLQDDVLASACVLVLYELFDPTEGRLDAWLGHLAGVYRVLQNRGPYQLRSTASRAILEHARYILMFQHLTARKACFLSDPEWLSAPWEDAEKSVEQIVFDNGLRLSGIFERCDIIAGQKVDMPDSEAFLDDCIDVFRDTEGLLRDHIRPAVGFDLEGGPAIAGESLRIRNPAALLLSITAEAIKLGACDSASRVVIQRQKPSFPCESNVADLEMISSNVQSTAKQILHSINTCMALKIGAMGAARMLFALRLALRQFSPFSPEHDRCQRLLDIVKDKDTRFGQLDESHQRAYSVVVGVVPATELVLGNASAIASRWEHFADISVSAEQSGQ